MTHTHLTRERRSRGECPACDDEWAAQDERLAANGTFMKAERSIAALVAKEAKLADQRYGDRATDA